MTLLERLSKPAPWDVAGPAISFSLLISRHGSPLRINSMTDLASEGSGNPPTLMGPGGAWSIRSRLALLVFALAVPLNLLIAAAIWEMAKQARTASEINLKYTAHAVIGAVDAYLMRHIALAEALAKSPALLENDLNAFRLEAERAYPDTSTAWLLVSDVHGHQEMNLLVPPGQPLPSRSNEAMTLEARAFLTRSMVISGVFKGAFRDAPIVTIEIPIFREDAAFRELAVAIEASAFLRLLSTAPLPNGWLIGVADRSGRYIARTEGQDNSVGRLASEGWRATMSHEGVTEFASLEGDRIINANAISPVSGWTAGVAVKKETFDAPLTRIVSMAAAVGTLISILTLIIAYGLARSITGSIGSFADNAAALVNRQSASFGHSLPELMTVRDAIKRAVAERDLHEDQQQVLVTEMSHRVKNILSIVQSIAVLTSRSAPQPDAFVKMFTARVSTFVRVSRGCRACQNLPKERYAMSRDTTVIPFRQPEAVMIPD